MDVILQQILQAVVSLVVTAVFAYLTKLVSDFIKSSISAKNLVIVQEFVRGLVLAAEQSGLSGYIKDEGQAKKEWVIGRLEEILKERNINFPVRVLSDMVEAAVFEYLNNSNSAPPVSVDPTGGQG